MSGRWVQPAVALIVVLGYFLAQVAVMSYPLPQANHDLIQRTFGTMDVMLGTVIGYYFGGAIREKPVVPPLDDTKPVPPDPTKPEGGNP